MTEAMKMMRFIIPFYICLFFGGPMQAQSQLPVSLKPYAHNLQSTMVAGLRELGYATPQPQVLTAQGLDQHSNALRLDSTKTFYQYNVPIPGDSTPLYRTIFTYPAPDQKVEEESSFENGNWQTTSRSTITLDQLNRVIKVDAVVFDPTQQMFIPDSKIEAYPHANSETLLDSLFVWQWNPDQSEWLLLIANRNFYDAQDNILEAYSIFNAFGQWLDLKEVYTYDGNGDNVQASSYVIIDGIEYPAGTTETEYLNHLPVVSIEFGFDENGGSVPQSKFEYTYTNFNQVETVKTYELSGDWYQSQEKTYSYDAQQRLIAVENRYFPPGEPEVRDKLAYQYQQDNYLAFEDTYFWNEVEGFLLDERKHYYYSGGASSVDQPVTPAQLLVVYPNPTNGGVTLQLDAPAYVEIYNSFGQRVSTVQSQPFEQLMMGDLPAGLYYMKARTERGVYTGSIVKTAF